MQQMALGCFLPNIQMTDGKIYALLKPDALITYQYEWSSKETLLLGLKTLYASCGGSLELTTHSAKDDKDELKQYNAIRFTGEELIKIFSEDLAANHAALKVRGGKG